MSTPLNVGAPMYSVSTLCVFNSTRVFKRIVLPLLLLFMLQASAPISWADLIYLAGKISTQKKWYDEKVRC
jgi:hypothetical protein